MIIKVRTEIVGEDIIKIKSKGITMKRKLILILTFFVFSFTGCSKEPNWAKKLRGKYYGQMWSGGSELGCTTTFIVDEKGNISANYVMIEPYSAEDGKLYNCKLKDTLLKCKWRDKYGYGDAKLKFSKDFSKFEGYWNDENKLKQHFVWRGSKENAHTKQAEIIINKLNMQELLDNLTIAHFQEMIKIYPILKKHQKVFFNYYHKYLNFNLIKDDLISFCITVYSEKDLDKIIKTKDIRGINLQNIENQIKFQGLIIARSKANKNFDEFLKKMEKIVPPK